MPEWLGPVLFGAAVIGLGVGIQLVRPALRQRRAANGRAVRLSVGFAGARAPYPRQAVPGRLLIGPDALCFRQASGVVLDLAPVGLRVQRLRDTTLAEGLRDKDDTAVVCADGHGTAVIMTTDLETAMLLRDTLGTRRMPNEPGAVGVSGTAASPWLWWPLVTTAVGLAALAFVGFVFMGSIRVQATVLEVVTDEDDYTTCRIAWTDPRSGAERVNEVDCYADTGDRLEVIGFGPPFVGESVSTDTPWFAFGAGFLILLTGIGGRLWRGRRWGSSPESPMAPMAPTGAESGQPPDVPTLGAGDLTWGPISDVAQRRASAEGWDVLDGGKAARFIARRRQLGGFATLAFMPGVAVMLALLFGWTSYAGVIVGFGEVGQATATVSNGEPLGNIPFVTAQDLEVRFTTAAGQDVATLVAVRGWPDDAPRTLAVEYSVDAPERARALEYGGHVLGATSSTVVIVGALGVVAWFAVPFLSNSRARRRALAHGPVTSARYALFLDLSGDCIVLVFAGADHGPAGAPPLVVVLSQDVRGRLPVTGWADVHGIFAEGEPVAVSTGGEPLPVASVLLPVDDDDLLELVNASDLTPVITPQGGTERPGA